MIFRIDIKIFLLLFLFFITKQLELYLIIMISVIIHEFGHLLVGFLLKMKLEKLELLPVGISVSFKIDMKNLNKKIGNGNLFDIKKILVAIAGPLTNVIIIFVVNKLNFSITKEMLIIYANFLIIIFNLLPIYPLDGGRILKSFLHILFGRRKASVYINNISVVLTIMLTALCSILVLYLHNIAIAVVILYLCGIVFKESLKFRRLEKVYKIIESNAIVTN